MSGGVDVPGLTPSIVAPIYDHVFANHTHEVGGVLVGTLGDKALPTITGSIAALEARGERASVTFTHDAWATVHATLERDHPGQQIVGWYHSHPGFGIFLSHHDLFIHENFFSDPRQIAYVIDPHAGTEGVFTWSNGRVVELLQRPAGRAGTGVHRLTITEAQAQLPTTPAQPLGTPIRVTDSTDRDFVRRAALLAAILGTMSGVAFELVAFGGDAERSPQAVSRPAK